MSRKDDLDNHSRQCDPQHEEYWKSRGWEERPADWEQRKDSSNTVPDKNY